MPDITIDTLNKISGSVSEGGWRATGAIINDADRIAFYQEFFTWFYLHLSDGWEALPRPAYRGHLVPENWQKSFQTSVAPWSAILAQEIMKLGQVQGIFYKNVASAPANRHQIIGLNYAKIIYELIGGHCNLMAYTEASIYDSQLWAGAFTTPTWNEGFVFLDLDISGSTLVSDYTLKEGNFWERIQEMANIEFYLAWVDLYNTFHYRPHPMFDTFLPPVTMTLTSDHLLQPLKVQRRNTEGAGQVILHGTTPAGLQISGRYPSQPTAGPIIEKSGYLATSNGLMTTVATRMYKFSNRDYRIEAKIGNGVGLLLALLDRMAITYTSAPDGIGWSSKKFWIDEISVEVKEDFSAVTTLVMDAEAA